MLRKFALIGIVFLIALCVGNVSAQKKAKPDFTGTWTLDRDKSSSLYKRLTEKPVAPSNVVEKVTETLTIAHTEPRFEILEKKTVEKLDSAGKLLDKSEIILGSITLFTDKRGEINTVEADRKHSSVTTWDGKKIFTAITLDKDRRQVATIRFVLSKDGKELLVTKMGFSPGGADANVTPPISKVYKKAE